MQTRPAQLLSIATFAVALALSAAPAWSGGGVSGSLGFTGLAGRAGDDGGWYQATRVDTILGSFGSDDPEYSDAFEIGGIARIEPFYDITPMIRGHVGIAGARWKGKTYDDPYVSAKFGDLKMRAIYAGIKVRFLDGRRFRPYAGANLGVAHFDAVDVTGLHGTGNRTHYFDKTDTVYFDTGGGCEFVLTPKVALFADVRIMMTGKPKSADPPASDAGGIVGFPFTAGVNVAF
jgi:hypothetical protein